jgi:hypothetical protein
VWRRRAAIKGRSEVDHVELPSGNLEQDEVSEGTGKEDVDSAMEYPEEIAQGHLSPSTSVHYSHNLREDKVLRRSDV